MLKKFTIGTLVVAAFAFASVASAYDFGTTTLKIGSKGEAVKTLQTLVGATPADGIFGKMTAAKVKVWQANNGLTADGVFGAMSKAKANATASTGGTTGTTGTTCPAGYVATTPVAPLFASCVASTTTPTTPSTLAGVNGEVTEVTQISAYSNEEVGDGQKDVKVMGFDVKTSKDGDVEVKSIKLTFDSNGNGAADSDRLSDYLTAVNVYAGSTKIGSANVADFTKDSTGVYSKTITFTGAVVKADTTVKMYVSVDAVANLDSGDIDSDSWTVGINSIRYVDGGGVTTTITNTDSILAGNMDYDAAGDGVAISFVGFAAAADTELKITVGTDTPAAGISTVKTTADTAKVTILTGKFKVEGTSNVWLDEVPFLFTTNATNVDDVTPTVYLTIDGSEYAESMTSSAGTTEVITFDNLDKTLTAGQTYTFTVKADINDIETTYFDEGDYLKAELDSTRRALIVAENTAGDQLTDSTEMTGTAMGNIQYFYSIAPKVEVVSASITPNSNGNSSPVSATAKLKVKVTAQGGTIYINGANELTAAKEFLTLAVDGGDASSSVSSYSYTTTGTYTTTNSGSDNEYFTISDGDSMYVDVEAVVVEATGSSAILVGMKASAVLFGTDATSDTTRSANSLSFSSLTDILKTGKTTLDS